MAKKVLITQNTKEKLPLSSATFEKVFALTLKELKKTKEYKNFSEIMGDPKSMELHFCDDKEMRGYQKKFRKLDRTTDVLSFSSLESPENNETSFMGSLIVSMATVERNAKRYKRTVKLELLDVYIHGILHLLSFDHVKVSTAKKQRMRKTQRDIFLKAQKL